MNNTFATWKLTPPISFSILYTFSGVAYDSQYSGIENLVLSGSTTNTQIVYGIQRTMNETGSGSYSFEFSYIFISL